MEADVRDARPEDAPALANLLDDLGYEETGRRFAKALR